MTPGWTWQSRSLYQRNAVIHGEAGSCWIFPSFSFQAVLEHYRVKVADWLPYSRPRLSLSTGTTLVFFSLFMQDEWEQKKLCSICTLFLHTVSVTMSNETFRSLNWIWIFLITHWRDHESFESHESVRPGLWISARMSPISSEGSFWVRIQFTNAIWRKFACGGWDAQFGSHSVQLAQCGGNDFIFLWQVWQLLLGRLIGTCRNEVIRILVTWF